MSDEQQHHTNRQQQQQQQQQQHALQAHNSKVGKDNSNNAADSSGAATTANNSGAASASAQQPAPPPPPPRKSNIHEMRNQEFVSRLMAATPPYLYSAPVGPNNFFFSDMLRSLVQARNNETARNLQLQQAALARRPRKRTSWSHPHPHSHPHRAYYEQHLRERKEAEERQQQLTTTSQGTNEKPLELTTTNNKSFYHLANKYRKLDDTTPMARREVPSGAAGKLATDLTESTTSLSTGTDSSTIETTAIAGGGGDAALQNNTPPAASLPPQDLVLPPPPPVWYPSLYPPYGIDPLHFFIDLRVSGHIYDRKKDNGNVSPLTTSGTQENVATGPPEHDSSNGAGAAPITSNTSPLAPPNKHRHGSAFTVPVPRSNESKAVAVAPGGLHNPNPDVINLSSNSLANKFEHYAKYYDLGLGSESKENQPFLKSGANASASANYYMLQHLPRLYSQFAARDLIGQQMMEQLGSDNTDNKSEEGADCDADSTDGGRTSTDAVDVEIIDSIKYHHRNSVMVGGGGGGGGNDEESSSRCSSRDDASITQID